MSEGGRPGSRNARHEPLRVAVIGLGAMGRHHARVLADLPGVDLVAVADVSEAAVEQATRGRTLRGFTDAAEMLRQARPDAVTVAVPTRLHLPVAAQAMAHGAHVLIEKPIASSLDEAAALTDAAERHGVGLMVGHIERFNPAIRELRQRFDQIGDPYLVSARRVGPFPGRVQDVGVVVDLASHDIDTMRFLLRRPAERVWAETARRIHADHEDMLLGTIRFADGIVGSLNINWLTPTKVRELTVVGSRGTFVADSLMQQLAFYENAAAPVHWESLADLRDMREGNATRYAIPASEPLRVELEAFTAWVREGGACPASPEDATETLAIALDLIRSADLGLPVEAGSPRSCRVPALEAP